ncbi:MAG: tetratricopeptide repeat protein [Parcubacteria group bacterium]
MRWLTAMLMLVACLLGYMPSVEADNKAQKLFDQGKRSYLMADFEKAQGILSEAIKKAPPGSDLKAQIYYYLALCHGEAGKELEATVTFARALVIDPGICRQKSIKQKFIKLCLDQRGKMQGTLSVRANLEASILIAGKEVGKVGKVPRLFKLPIGDHQVEVKSPDGQQVQTKKVTVYSRKVTRVSFVFRLPPTPAPASKPSTQRASVTPKPGPKKPQRKSKRIWTWVAAGTAVGALVAFSVLQATARSKFADWEDGAAQAHRTAAEANQLNELASDIDREQTASWIMFGVAGAAAVGAVVLFFAEGGSTESSGKSAPSKRSRLQLLPVLGKNPGAMLRLEF